MGCGCELLKTDSTGASRYFIKYRRCTRFFGIDQ